MKNSVMKVFMVTACKSAIVPMENAAQRLVNVSVLLDGKVQLSFSIICKL